jgi:thiamine pyrophosphate-dependent acetolactate synthase large subunit-like protein
VLGNFVQQPPTDRLMASATPSSPIGTRFRDFVMPTWEVTLPSCLIKADLDERGIGRNYPVAFEIVDDSTAAIVELADRLSAVAPQRRARSNAAPPKSSRPSAS